MNRRAFLAVGGTSLTTALAGCSSLLGSDDQDSDPNNTTNNNPDMNNSDGENNDNQEPLDASPIDTHPEEFLLDISALDENWAQRREVEVTDGSEMNFETEHIAQAATQTLATPDQEEIENFTVVFIDEEKATSAYAGLSESIEPDSGATLAYESIDSVEEGFGAVLEGQPNSCSVFLRQDNLLAGVSYRNEGSDDVEPSEILQSGITHAEQMYSAWSI